MRAARFAFWLFSKLQPVLRPVYAWLDRRGRLRPVFIGLFLATVFTAIVYFVSPMPYTAARDFTRNGPARGYHHLGSAAFIGIASAIPCALFAEWQWRKYR